MTIIRSLSLFIITVVLLGSAPGHAEGPAPEATDFERGPHRGRLLRDGDFALEVTIFETGVPPQFRLFAYDDNTPLAPEKVDAAIELSRLGGTVDRFTFSPDGEALVGSGTVVEPHSFDVTVTATENGRQHRWEYASYEGRTIISSEVAEGSGIRTEAAGPATIQSTVTLMGRVNVDANRVARIRARFPGPVQHVPVRLGERVQQGQVLATVESNESMQTYSVKAPIAGLITARNTNVGDVAGDAPLFEVTDLSEVWADLHVFGRDVERLKPGQSIRISDSIGGDVTEASLDSVLPVVAPDSQTSIARVRLPNPQGRWRPGTAVSATVTVAEHAVPLAVRTAGLQRFRDFTVVFAQVGETYEVRMLELGRRDSVHVEVLSGLDPGTRYVSEQSFLIRADIEKSGASHDH